MKQPYALLLNDIHISTHTIPDFKANWNEALQICDKNNINKIIVGGDLWHSRVSQTLDTLWSVKQALHSAIANNIEVILAEGNHDKVNQSDIIGYSHVFHNGNGIKAIDKWECYAMDSKVSLYVVSYFPEKEFPAILDEILDSPDFNDTHANILYIHQGVLGALSTPSDSDLPANLFIDFDKVLVGHYHDRVSIAGTNVEYIGSSRQHNFGEDEEKGYTIMYTDGSYEFVKNTANKRFKTVDVPFDQLSEQTLNDILGMREDGRYLIKVRVMCENTQVSLVNKNELLAKGISRVEVVSDDPVAVETAQLGFEQQFDKSGIIEEYYRFCDNKGYANHEFGVKYLQAIND